MTFSGSQRERPLLACLFDSSPLFDVATLILRAAKDVKYFRPTRAWGWESAPNSVVTLFAAKRARCLADPVVSRVGTSEAAGLAESAGGLAALICRLHDNAKANKVCSPARPLSCIENRIFELNRLDAGPPVLRQRFAKCSDLRWPPFNAARRHGCNTLDPAPVLRKRPSVSRTWPTSGASPQRVPTHNRWRAHRAYGHDAARKSPFRPELCAIVKVKVPDSWQNFRYYSSLDSIALELAIDTRRMLRQAPSGGTRTLLNGLPQSGNGTK